MKNKRVVLSIVISLVALLTIFIIIKQTTSSKLLVTARQGVASEAEYWTCAMHPSVKSDKPGKCPLCGMDLIPVTEEAPQPAATARSQEEAYYSCGIKEEGHCPHCDEEKSDAQCICGGHSFLMKGDKIATCPVCKNPLKKIEPVDFSKEEHAAENVVSRVKLNQQQLNLAGIEIEPVAKRSLFKVIRTVGRIAFDPELTITQQEFLTAQETLEKVSQSPDPGVIERARDILDKSRLRLRLLAMSDKEIDDLAKEGKAQTNLVLPEDKAWVYAEVFEYELSWVKEGQEVKVTATAFPGEEFKGTIRAISPILDPETRSAKIRLEVDNVDKKLKPEMYVDVFIRSEYMASDGTSEVLAVPREAVLDTGLRKIVYVNSAEGVFLGKEIKAGPEAISLVNDTEVKFYPVLSGVDEGEIVVTKGNFLIDSQSQLSGGMSVLWGGASEIKDEQPASEPVGIQVEHKH